MQTDLEIQFHTHTLESPMSYRNLDVLQRQVQARVLEGGSGTLLLSEVSPVITCGRRTVKTDILLSEETLRAKGTDLFVTDRGGLATYHGPGQWILFPVERLQVLTGDSRGVRKVVQALLEIALEVVQVYDPEAKMEWGPRTGVWGRTGKYAAVGIHIDQGVVLHGMALNVYRTEESFIGLRPCGIDAAPAFLAETPTWRAWNTKGEHSELRRFFAEIGWNLAETALQKMGPGRGLTTRNSCVKPDSSFTLVGA